MQTKYRKYLNFSLLIATLFLVSASILFTSCEDEEEGNDGKIVLNSYGPMPVARGAELRFIGNNLDKVSAIMLPGDIEIPASAFTSKTATLVSITVPQNAVEGFVIVKTPQGDITTKTPMGFSEPISIASYSPVVIKADSVLTISGDYLNLVKQIIFTDRVTVDVADFVSQSRSQIKVKVPAAAQAGKIAVSNGNADPIIVYSADALNVILPAISTIAPNPVKAGTNLTITGTNLDLVKTVALGGNQNVTSFVSQSASQIVLKVPDVTQDDTLRLIPASGVKVKSAAKLVMVVPTVSVTPTTVKNGAEITVTGTNLDLIDKVTFGGAKDGAINAGGTATQIVVTIPNDAVTDTVKFITKANKTVKGPKLIFVDPVITSIVPTTTKAKTDITITGTDLDLVVDVNFVGGVKGAIAAGRTETELVVTVPVGAKDGKITLVAKNGVQVQSATDLTILANLPTITSFSEAKGTPGEKLTLNGTSMLLIKELIFPGNVKATAYGEKTDTKVEVYVPKTVTTGTGTITLITYEGEEGISPEIFIGGTDPVLDPSLMIYSFDAGWSGFTWDGVGGLGTIADGVDGTKNYYQATPWDASKYWLFANNYISYASVSHADHVVKMDVRLRNDVTGNAEIRLMLGGKAVNILSYIKSGDKFTTNSSWITISIPLSAFSGLANPTPVNGGEWGMTMWGNGLDFSGFCIDNIRYEKIN